MNDAAGDEASADRGESLLELLMSIAIIGIAVIAVLGAIAMSTSASTMHRGQAQAQNAIRNWAEAVTNQTYVPCRASGVVMPGGPGGPAALPAGYTPRAPEIEHWTGSAWADSCPAGGDRGIQRITLTLTAPSDSGPFDQTLAVVVRNPCRSETDPGC